MTYRWLLAPEQPALAGEIARELRIGPLLAQCLLNRSLTEPPAIQRFLEPRLKQLADPFLLPGMEPAVERLFRARRDNEPLVLFGDYDVDGVTSTAVLLEVLRALGWHPNCYLPNRFDEGYGLSLEALTNCLERFPASLLVALDCGSTSNESVAWLRQRGVDVIILDHHQVASPPPSAYALVNPLLGGATPPPPSSRSETGPPDSFDGVRPPFSELCSAGLAFKLAHALVKRGRETGLAEAADFDLRPLLELVAIGTVADLVPLVGENRILVAAGLARLDGTQRPGLVALKEVAGSSEPLTTFEVAFQLGPRLNAAGRLETAEESLRLLLTSDADEALALAEALDRRNVERKKLEGGILEEAFKLVRGRFKPEADFVIVEGHALWHIGVVGIVAARLLQHYYRPTIIVGGDGPDWRGSGRSILGFDMAAALRQCADLLIRHGGHSMAAGLSLQPKNLDALRLRLNQLARQILSAETLCAPLRLDAAVDLDGLTLPCLDELARLQPLGQGNPAAQFLARKVVHRRPAKRLGANGQHAKMWVGNGTMTHQTIWWRAGEQPLPSGCFDLAFAPQIDSYKGQRSVLLKLLDWRPAPA